MDFKTCPDCELLLDIENFYTYVRNDGKGRWYSRRCKPCDIAHNQERRRKEREENGGSSLVPFQPNQYTDEAQKKQTFDTLKAIGWKFNKENGIWYDDKIKDKNGNWLIKFKVRIDPSKRNSQLRELIKPDDLLVLPDAMKLKPGSNEFEAIYEYFINRLKPKEIERKYGVTKFRMDYLATKSLKVIRPKYEPSSRATKRFIPLDKLPYFTFKLDKTIPQDIINNVIKMYYFDCISLPDIIKYYPQYPKHKLRTIITKTLTNLKNER